MLVAIDPAARRDWLAGFSVSAALHLILFFGGWALFRSAQYGVEPGTGGLEISLVAAPPRAVSTGVAEELPKAFPADPESGEEVLAGPARAPVFSGDGSSPVPGKSSTTFFSEGGGQSEAEPGPFRNPAPPYPMAARRLGQEGSVLLRIAISATGRPARVEIQRGSGFPLLDESALTTVRRWRFLPARTAGLPRDSVASLRIRFRLKESGTINAENRRME